MMVKRIEGLFLTYFLRTSVSCILFLSLELFFLSTNNYKHFLLVLFVQNFSLLSNLVVW
jgi:hypothetical protein